MGSFKITFTHSLSIGLSIYRGAHGIQSVCCRVCMPSPRPSLAAANKFYYWFSQLKINWPCQYLFYWQFTTTPFLRMQSSCSMTGGQTQCSPSPVLCFYPSPHQSRHHMYLCIHLPRVFSDREWRVSNACRHWDKRACSCFPPRISCSTLRGLPYWLFEAWKDDIERPRFSFLNLRWQPHCPWLPN